MFSSARETLGHTLPLVVFFPPPMQHTLPPTPRPRPSALHVLPSPPPQLIAPAASDQHPADDVHDPDTQRQETATTLADGEQYRLDVELEENAGDALLGYLVRLGGDGVLVGEDGAGGGERRVGGAVQGNPVGECAGVDGGYDGEVVLELVEVRVGGGKGMVERIEEGGVEGPERELIYYVGEVEN